METKNESEKPIISVIMPAFNAERYMQKCIESLQSQTYERIEIVVVDDGSTDNTLDIATKMAQSDSRIKVYHKQNGGAASARNFGIDKATGSLIGFVDSDDYVSKDMYEELQKALAENPKSDIVNCDSYDVLENGSVLPYKPDIKQGTYTNEAYFSLLLTFSAPSSLWRCLLKRELLETSKFRDGAANEDFLFWCDIITKIRYIYHLGKPLYFYVLRNGSISRSGFSKTIVDSIPNSNIAFDLAKKQFSSLITQAQSFYMQQRYTYLARIPLSLMNKRNEQYVLVLNEVKHHKKWIKNPYLSRKIQNRLTFICFFPHIFSIAMSIRNRIK
jgi:glycosyltransferase involved in cell wall biosynthesis